MKKCLIVAGVLIVAVFSFSGKAQTVAGPETTLRIFFQTVDDDMRFTGCVNLGGTCFSEDPSVVQDCLVNGRWIPCGWE